MSNEKEADSAPRDIADEKTHHPTDAEAHEGERHGVHHDIPDHGHNPSLQKDVIENPDMTLHYSHEHQHNHMHHGRSSLVDRHDDILFAKGGAIDNRHDFIVDQDHSHHQHAMKPTVDAKDHVYSETSTSDPEKAGLETARIETNDTDDEQKHRFSRFYRKYKLFFHLFVWLVFTAYVSSFPILR